MGRTFQVVQTLQFQGLTLALILVAQVLVIITVVIAVMSQLL